MARPRKVSYTAKNRGSDMAKITFIITLFAIVLGGFIYAVLIRAPIEATTKPPEGPFPAIKAEDLGKTAGTLKDQYPELFLTRSKHGLMIGQHKLDGANYTIWFVAENREYLAFRIKATTSFDKLKEQDLLTYFGQLYGRPFDGACSSDTTYALQKCSYKWWVREGVKLDVHSRLKKDKSVEFNAISTDTYLSSKHHHTIRSVVPVN
jgi:hypothetical protein